MDIVTDVERSAKGDSKESFAWRDAESSNGCVRKKAHIYDLQSWTLCATIQNNTVL